MAEGVKIHKQKNIDVKFRYSSVLNISSSKKIDTSPPRPTIP